MLESLFTSKARVKILEIFLLNKEREFHIRELARILDISPPYIMKEFNNLKTLGILSERKDGNMIFYKINKSKMEKIIKTLHFFISQNKISYESIRIDAIFIQDLQGRTIIEHIENITI